MDQGIGSFGPNTFHHYLDEHMSDMFEYAAKGNLYLNLKEFPLSDISQAWKSKTRAVVTI